MPYFQRGDRVTFTGEAVAELFGVVGIVVRRRVSNRHYVYDIQLSVRPNINMPGLRLSARGILQNVPSDWFEISR